MGTCESGRWRGVRIRDCVTCSPGQSSDAIGRVLGWLDGTTARRRGWALLQCLRGRNVWQGVDSEDGIVACVVAFWKC